MKFKSNLSLFFQQYLSNEDYEGKKSEEIGKLEQTILTQLKVSQVKNKQIKKFL